MNKNDEVPTRFIEQLRQAEGDRHTELLLGSQERGTNVYLIVHQENVVGFCKSRSGIFVERWYRPLEPQDVIIFGATVFPEYRGLGYAPAAYDALCRLHDGVGVVYIDAVRNNKAAIRAIEKAGFLIEGVYRIGEWKPI
jgi:RimJ/RimL family protein N-acetyltransferase